MTSDTPSVEVLHARIKDKQLWHITLTCSGGLDVEFRDKVCFWMRQQEYSFVKYEDGKSGANPHLHVVCTVPGSQGPSNVRKMVRRAFYGTRCIGEREMRVQKVNSLSGIMHYLDKDDGHVQQITGFTKTFIKSLLEQNYNAIKTFTKWKYLKVGQVPGAIIAYCDLHNLPHPKDRQEFCHIMGLLASTMYSEPWVKKTSWIYAATMEMAGRKGCYEALFLEQLHFVQF